MNAFNLVQLGFNPRQLKVPRGHELLCDGHWSMQNFSVLLSFSGQMVCREWIRLIKGDRRGKISD